MGPCTASSHGKWSQAHWKQSSTGSDGGDGGCSNVASHHSDWSLNGPPCGKEEWNPSLQLQRIQDSHVRFALDFSGIVHVSFYMVFQIGACLTLRMIDTIYV